MWQSLYRGFSGTESTDDGVLLTLEGLRSARLLLAAAMPPDVFKEMARLLAELEGDLGLDVSGSLTPLADQSLSGDDPCVPWYRLGVAVGDCRRLSFQEGPMPGQPTNHCPRRPGGRPALGRSRSPS